jgi:hypothetical protein
MRVTTTLLLLTVVAGSVSTIVGAPTGPCAVGCKEISIYKSGAQSGECYYYSETTAKGSIHLMNGQANMKIVNYSPTETIKTYYKPQACNACTHTCDSPQTNKLYEASGTAIPSGGTTDCPEYNFTRQKCVPKDS